MDFPVYCIIGSRAVRAFQLPDGSLDVQAYVAEEDEFRRAPWFLDQIARPGMDVEFVSKDELEDYVARQRAVVEAETEEGTDEGAETRESAETRDRKRREMLRLGRMLLIQTVRKTDAERADFLEPRFGSGVSHDLELAEERSRTQELIDAVSDIESEELRHRIVSVRTLTGLEG